MELIKVKLGTHAFTHIFKNNKNTKQTLAKRSHHTTTRKSKSLLTNGEEIGIILKSRGEIRRSMRFHTLAKLKLYLTEEKKTKVAYQREKNTHAKLMSRCSKFNRTNGERDNLSSNIDGGFHFLSALIFTLR